MVKAEEDLTTCTEQRRTLREKINAMAHQYRSAEKALSQLELQLAKIQMEVWTFLDRVCVDNDKKRKDMQFFTPSCLGTILTGRGFE
jgi:uncharacterized protein (DUF3084 family)